MYRNVKQKLEITGKRATCHCQCMRSENSRTSRRRSPLEYSATAHVVFAGAERKSNALNRRWRQPRRPRPSTPSGLRRRRTMNSDSISRPIRLGEFLLLRARHACLTHSVCIAHEEEGRKGSMFDSRFFFLSLFAVPQISSPTLFAGRVQTDNPPFPAFFRRSPPSCWF